MPESRFIESMATPAGGYSRTVLDVWFRVPWPPQAGWKADLLASSVPALYRRGLSACVIAGVKDVSRAEVSRQLRRAGLAGKQWCPQCRKEEYLTVK